MVMHCYAWKGGGVECIGVVAVREDVLCRMSCTLRSLRDEETETRREEYTLDTLYSHNFVGNRIHGFSGAEDRQQRLFFFC